MEQLPEELISQIMQFLPTVDRNQASLVCKRWYSASLNPQLQKDVIVRCKENLPPTGLITHKITHLEFGGLGGQNISEEALLSLLKECPCLELLDLSGCNSLFISGQLLSKDKDVKPLRQTLVNVRVLKLCHLKYMTDITFERLVSVMENIEHLSLSSSNMIFGHSLYKANQSSPAMLHFSAFLKFAESRVDKLKYVDLSYTSLQDEDLGVLAKINNLVLDGISLRGCSRISDKGLKLLASNQHCLNVLDVSDCKEIGDDKELFRILANNLPNLQTLIMRQCVKIGLSDVTALSEFVSLRTLDMGNLRLFDKDLIRGLCFQGQSLTSLYMPACPDVSDEFVVELCRSSYNLTDLDFSSCHKLTDVSLYAITRSLTSLQSLHLNNCREITDMGILGLVPEKGIVARFTFDFDHEGCPCSRERDSKIFRKPGSSNHNHCTAKDHLIKHGEPMYMLSNLTSLRVLDLSCCPKITDVSIGDAVRFSNLRCLYLNGLPKVGEKGVKAVACNNSTLEDVRLANNPLVTDAAIAELVINCQQLSSLDVSQCVSLTDGCLKPLTAYSKKMHHLNLSFTNLTVKAVASMHSYLPKTKIVFKPHFD